MRSFIKIIIFCHGLFALVSHIIAQQEQQYTQYMVNGYLLNPAMGGTEEYADVKVGYRKQWLGLNSSPRSIFISGHTSVGRKFGSAHNHTTHEHKYWHGLGGYLYSDKTGPISRTTFLASYAFNMPLTKKLRISTGAFLGMKNFQFDPDGYEVADDGDFLIQQSNAMSPDLSLGIWLYNHQFFVGLSMFQLLNQTVDHAIYEIANSTYDGDQAILKRHLFLTGGLKVPLSYTVNIVPSFALKAIGPAPASLDLNGKIDFNDQYWMGISYRVMDAASVLVGTVINNQLELSYSYDWTHSSLRNANTGSHEIIIGYRIKHNGHVDCPSNFW